MSESMSELASAQAAADPAQPCPRLLDPRLEQELERDGYTVSDFLEMDAVERLREAFFTFDVEIHRAAFGSTLQSHDLDYRATVNRLVLEAFEPAVRRLFNGYRLCFGNYTVKQPRNVHGEMPFHQDPTFVDETRFQSLGIWCPLVDVDEANGCLYIVPGSHRLNHGPRGPLTSFPYGDLIPLLLAEHARPVQMKAGQAVIFCQRVFHTSPPNRGEITRVVATALTVPAAAQLRYYQQDHARAEMEVFEVEDLFYTRHIIGGPAREGRSIGVVDYYYEPVTVDRLAQ